MSAAIDDVVRASPTSENDDVVLVLDVDEESAARIMHLIETCGGRARNVSTYLEFDALLTEEVSLVVLDLKLPGIDGIEVLRMMAAHGYKGAVLICSDIERRHLRAAERIGREQKLQMLQGLQKPVSEKLLVTQMQKIQQLAANDVDEFSSAIQFTSQDVLNALEANQITFHFQPIIELDEGRCVSVEALVRWQHPKFGILTAGHFIDAADEIAHRRLFQLIMTDTLERYASWRERGSEFKLNLNLSVINLHMLGLPEFVSRHTEQVGIPSEMLNFEVTEERIGGDYLVAMENLIRLNLKGYNVSIDDFGTEFASFRRLGQLPIDTLKLDRKLIQNAMNDTDALAIMESCVALGHKMNLWVTAEGIESEGQLDLARELGCNAVQGFYLATPVPECELMTAIADAEERCSR